MRLRRSGPVVFRHWADQWSTYWTKWSALCQDVCTSTGEGDDGVIQEARAIPIGVVGAGTISQSIHLESLRRAGFEVRVVCDLSPSRAAQVAASVGARAATDPAEVFESDVDAVLLATPGTHAELAAEAIRAGKHVLAEKPLAFTVREVDALEQLAAHFEVVTQVGYMKMFDPLLDTAVAELAALHDVRLVRVTVAHPADEPQVAHLRMGLPPDDADPAAIAAAVEYDHARAAEALQGADESLLAYYANVLNGSVLSLIHISEPTRRTPISYAVF